MEMLKFRWVHLQAMEGCKNKSKQNMAHDII